MTRADMTYGDIVLMIEFCIAIPICISLAGLLLFHCNLIRLNRTTMERTLHSVTGKQQQPPFYGHYTGQPALACMLSYHCKI